MSQLSSGMLINPQELHTSNATAEATLGDMAHTADGRIYRYVQNGATAMVPGRLFQAAAETTAHQNLAPAAAAIGDVSIDIKLGAVAALENEYAGGYMITTAGNNEGRIYLISGHAAVAASGTIVLKLAEPVFGTAIDANTNIDLVRNAYKGVIVAPTTETSGATGVALFAVAASEFGWVQTHGPAAVAAESAIAIGLKAIRSTDEAGAVSPITGINSDVEVQTIGVALSGIADSDFGAVYLTID